MDELRRKLEYFQDLGIRDLYRRPRPEEACQPGESASLASLPEVELPGLAPVGDTLARISDDIGDCTRCRLSKGRNKIVFGDGNPEAKLVFVGEGPGADEDAQGIPFVGRAGQLLTQMIENTAAKEGLTLKRPDVYICNVVKCRPPENRNPEPDEMEICGQFLFRQLSAIRPESHLRAGLHGGKGAPRRQRRGHEASW